MRFVKVLFLSREKYKNEGNVILETLIKLFMDSLDGENIRNDIAYKHEYKT